MRESTLLNVFNSTIDRLDNKIDILKEKKVENIDRRIKKIKLDEITENFVRKTKKKLTDLEECSRWNNLHIDGFQKEVNETWEKSERIIANFMEEKLKIEEDITI